MQLHKRIQNSEVMSLFIRHKCYHKKDWLIFPSNSLRKSNKISFDHRIDIATMKWINSPAGINEWTLLCGNILAPVLSKTLSLLVR